MRLVYMLLAAVLFIAGGTVAGARGGRATAVVADVVFDRRPGAAPETATARVIVGLSQGRWTGSEASRGLLPKGARLTLYSLGDSHLGSLRLLDEGSLLSRDTEGPGEGSRLEYMVSVEAAPGKLVSGEDGQESLPACFAVWHAAGSAEPRWVTSRDATPSPTKPQESTYQPLLLQWLRSQGVSRTARERMAIDQILLTDLNRDGRTEVLISAYSPSAWQEWPAAAPSKPFSYLLMRYLPSPSAPVRTVVLDAGSSRFHRVLALCDLDGDGWAEIVASYVEGTRYGYALYDWTGRQFQRVQGWEYRE